MKFHSTRGRSPAVRFSEAIVQGLAPDGGLYVPETFPTFETSRLAGLSSFDEVAAVVLEPYLAGDPLLPHLPEICREAFDFPLPLAHLARRTSVLELFHGPTAAFKDFGARFLASCLARLPETLTVLVATSGDTGAAVASAFHRKPGARVGVLFPIGGVSPRQEKQLTCWDGNVRSFAVRGTFDDCQRVVKRAFGHPGWPAGSRLSSANSINVGRLLPQAAYHAAASARYARERGAACGLIVPSGNIGNAAGAFWARRMGFPIRHIALACNANRVVPDWFHSGVWEPRTSRRTLANAMDVGDPSNMERLFHLHPDRASMLEFSSALSVDDATLRQVIAAGPERWGRVWCPHTAAAVHFREQLTSPDWVVVATAHPAKFDTVVEPLIDQPVPLPPALAELLARPNHSVEIGPSVDELLAVLE